MERLRTWVRGGNGNHIAENDESTNGNDSSNNGNDHVRADATTPRGRRLGGDGGGPAAVAKIALGGAVLLLLSTPLIVYGSRRRARGGAAAGVNAGGLGAGAGEVEEAPLPPPSSSASATPRGGDPGGVDVDLDIGDNDKDSLAVSTFASDVTGDESSTAPVPASPTPQTSSQSSPAASPLPLPPNTTTTTSSTSISTSTSSASLAPIVKVQTYFPGSLTVRRHDSLLLSTGLTSRVIARSGRRVRYGNGDLSSTKFHFKPDGAAVFAHPEGRGWVYVSNSEVGGSEGRGGVGMIRFDSEGNIIKYKRVLTGTQYNCSGGKTPWGTYISCEENEPIGQIYEVDPFGKRPAQRTVLGGSGGNYESVVVDNRNPYQPRIFVTNDSDRGELRRFTPNADVVRRAVDGDGDYWDVLSTPGKMQYLVLTPTSKGGWWGTFTWSSSLSEGRGSAARYFPKAEGIDFVDGIVYVALKQQKTILVLNLDEGTYGKFSTSSGGFRGEPDQLSFQRGDGNGVLYFTEDAEGYGTPAGVHAVDAYGNMFKILQETGRESMEMSGLAFSPDNMRMYVALWTPGIIFEVRRKDGLPFDGSAFNIRRHRKLDSSVASQLFKSAAAAAAAAEHSGDK